MQKKYFTPSTHSPGSTPDCVQHNSTLKLGSFFIASNSCSFETCGWSWRKHVLYWVVSSMRENLLLNLVIKMAIISSTSIWGGGSEAAGDGTTPPVASAMDMTSIERQWMEWATCVDSGSGTRLHSARIEQLMSYWQRLLLALAIVFEWVHHQWSACTHTVLHYTHCFTWHALYYMHVSPL